VSKKYRKVSYRLDIENLRKKKYVKIFCGHNKHMLQKKKQFKVIEVIMSKHIRMKISNKQKIIFGNEFLTI